jgi:hypothetical protein
VSAKTFLRIAGVIFLLVAIAHLLRLIFKWDVVLAGWPAPMWISAVAVFPATETMERLKLALADGRIQRARKLEAPIFLDDLRNHRVLRTSSFIRKNMQGNALPVFEYWPYLYEMIRDRNPKSRKLLSRLTPEKL